MTDGTRVTHRCDYCGATYSLEHDIQICKECGEFRVFNLVENRPTKSYNSLEQVEKKPALVPKSLLPPEKTKKPSLPKKESKDVSDRTNPSRAPNRSTRRF